MRLERLRRRNTVYRVTVGDSDAYFVKYMHPRSTQLGPGKEALVIDDLAMAGNTVLRRSLTAPLWRSDDAGILVYDAVQSDRTMADHVRGGRPSQRLARDLAVSLAALHRSPLPTYRAQVPHGLLVHHPTLEDLPFKSSASLELVALIQGNEQLVDDLDHAASSWQRDAFVHADLKFDNVLVRRGAEGRSRHVRIVDWEDAGAGDPRRDVGSVLGAYLAAWLTSIPHLPADSPARLAPLAHVSREVILPSVRTFWTYYTDHRGLDPQESDQFLQSAVRFAGVRLVQAASEGAMATPLTAVHLFLLQVGANLLARPQDAAMRLLALQPASVPPS